MANTYTGEKASVTFGGNTYDLAHWSADIIYPAGWDSSYQYMLTDFAAESNISGTFYADKPSSTKPELITKENYMSAAYLKNLDSKTASNEDLILANFQMEVLENGYIEFDLETPAWLLDKLEAVDTELAARRLAEIKRQMREAQNELDELKTKAEKREELIGKLDRLDKRLAK
jgi:hypothetical protein